MPAAIILLFISVFSSAVHAKDTKIQDGPFRVTCDHPTPLFKVPTYVKTVAEEITRMGGKDVECGSCYRDEGEQARACVESCGNPRGCGPPNNCAAPGKSQHQKELVATCDISKTAHFTCAQMKALCQQKFGGQCGIGVYPSGAAHFGVYSSEYLKSNPSPGIRFWSRCGGLGNAHGKAAGQRGRWQRIRGRHPRRRR